LCPQWGERRPRDIEDTPSEDTPIKEDCPVKRPARSIAPSETIPCLIVEDQRMFADLLVTMLRASPGLNIDVRTVAMDAAGGLAVVEAGGIDLLVLDLALPDGSGLQVAERLVQVNPEAAVIVLSAQVATFVCPEHLAGHIVAVVDKTDAYGALQKALGSLQRKRSSGVTVPDAGPAAGRPAVELSSREREVLLLVGQGLTSEEIASRLNITRHTVQSHRKKIASKVGTRGSELTHYAYQFWQRVAAGTSA
jgi:DNA-binding NarL/FixJ family response regulator